MKAEIEVIEDQIIYTVGEIELRLEQKDGGINPISFDFDGEEEYWDEHWEEIEEQVLSHIQKAEKLEIEFQGKKYYILKKEWEELRKFNNRR